MNFIVSYSSIHNYMQCPRAWWFRDVRRLGLVLDKRTGALGFGARFHKALEMWGNGEVSAPVDAWETLMDHEYGLATDRGGLELDDLSKEDTLGRVMLDGFLDWRAEEGEDQEYETIAVEKKLSNQLDITTPQGEIVTIWLYGKLDRLLRHREFGTYLIADWKTSKNMEQATKETLELSPQPRIYKALLAHEMPDIPVVGIRYTVFRKVLRTGRAVPPFTFNYDLNLSDYNVEQHLTRVSAIAGEMMGAVHRLESGAPHALVAPFNPGWQCRNCPFRGPCWLLQTASEQAAEDMLADQYHEVDPLERYHTETEETVDV